MLPPCVLALAASLFAAPLLASTQSASESPRPPWLRAAGEEADGLERWIELEPAWIEDLLELRSTRLAGLALPGGGEVTLRLDRLELERFGFGLRVGGRPAATLVEELGSSLWSGEVEGEPGSTVFLAFSRFGSHGWIRRGEETLHWIGVPGPEGVGGWSASRVRLIGAQEVVAGATPRTTFCADPPPSAREAAAWPSMAAGSTGSELLEARIAVETDYQLFEVFGDLRAQTAYVLALLAAVSERYEQQVGVRLTYPYLALYDDPDDPWYWDGDLNCSGIWLALQAAWGGGNIPADAHLGHFISGTSFECGVAERAVLCDPDFGFSVSGGIHGGTPLPVRPLHPLNWDFIVVAHELAHNFGSPHTSHYCPPLDLCARQSLWGPCQTESECAVGTLMSLCSSCPGGLTNIQPRFHPEVARVLRRGAEAACLPTICAAPVSTCAAKPNSCGELPVLGTRGHPSLSSPLGFVLVATGARAGQAGFLVYTESGVPDPPPPFHGGALCVRAPWFRGPLVIADGPPEGCAASYELDLTAFASGELGGRPAAFLSEAGARVACQWWGRDADGSAWLTGGLAFVLCP